MINFKLLVTAEKALPLQNRLVEYVAKLSEKHSTFGKISVWRGALKDEYFTIMFVGGVVVVSIEEREMELGKNSVTYAESQSLLDTAEFIKTASPELKLAIQEEYTKVVSVREQNDITFVDLMFILNWQYAEGAKVDESDMLGV